MSSLRACSWMLALMVAVLLTMGVALAEDEEGAPAEEDAPVDQVDQPAENPVGAEAIEPQPPANQDTDPAADDDAADAADDDAAADEDDGDEADEDDGDEADEDDGDGADEDDGDEADDDEGSAPSTRSKLRIIPDEVLDQASDDDAYVELGPQMTVIYGNANRFRRYTFTEPTNPLAFHRVEALGTIGSDDVMYDLYTETPLKRNARAGFQVRDFDGPATFRGEWQRFLFFQDYGNTATPSNRQDADALLRLRLGSKAWVDVTYQRRTFTSPAFTTRPVSFVSDEIGAETQLRIGGTMIGATFSVSQYTDNTTPINYIAAPMTANRQTLDWSVHAGTVSEPDLLWNASVGMTSSRYPTLNGRYTALTAGAGLRYQMGEDMAWKTGVSHVRTLQTFTQNTYNPSTTRARLTGTFTGINKLRMYFGYERRFGSRYNVTGGPNPQGFVENQGQERLWLKGRYRSNSSFIIEFLGQTRNLRGNITNYIGNNVLAVPILLYPNQTTCELTASYPTGAGLIKGGVTLGRYGNAGRQTLVSSWGLLGLWSRTWSDQWSTMAQVEHIEYNNRQPAAAGINTDLTSFVAASTWGFEKGNLSASYGLFDSRGAFNARQQNFQLGLEHTPRRHTQLGLTYDYITESLTGPLAFSGHVVMLKYRREF